MKPKQSTKFFLTLLIGVVITLFGGCTTPSPAPQAEIPTETALPPSVTVPPPSPTAVPATTTPEPTLTPTRKPSPTALAYPPAQGWVIMAYDSESEKLVLVPRYPDQGGTLYNQTWIFDLKTNKWRKLDYGPPPGEGPMAYDAQSDRIILFMGTEYIWPRLYPLGQTWSFDTNTETWTNMEPEESPYSLIGPNMVYDAESDRMILFSGADIETFTDIPETWAYDYDSNIWTKLDPAGSPPTGFHYFGMSYDSAADRVIVYKRRFNESLDTPEFIIGVFDYNANTWEQRQTELHPEAYRSTTMIFDPKSGLNILFGGLELYEVPSNETWSYDYANNRWQKLLTNQPPSPRAWHGIAYIDTAGEIIVFGGGPTRDTFTNETWLFDPMTNKWTNLTIDP